MADLYEAGIGVELSPAQGMGGQQVEGHGGPFVHPVQFAALPEREERTAVPDNLDLVLDVPLRLNVELGRATMLISDILSLGPGSVIELDKLAGEPVDVVVNDRVIARGEVVVVDESFGVRLTEIVVHAKRAATLV
jgi:flagellar motor switch protein FliN